MRRAARGLALLVAFASLALSAQPVGSELRVNTTTTGDQRNAAVASGNNSFVVVWQGSNGSNFDVFGQRLSASSGGTRIGGEFRVNTYTTDDQRYPSVSRDILGGFVVVWQSDNQQGVRSVFAQRYGGNGAPIGGEFRVNTFTTSLASSPQVAGDLAGNFVVVWHQNDGSLYGVFARRFRASGAPAGAEFRVNVVTTNFQFAPLVAVDGSGGFVVVWVNSDAVSEDVMGRRFDAAGAALSGEFRVNTFTTNNEYSPSVACDASGGFVVTWSRSNPGVAAEVHARRFAASGAPLAGELLVNGSTTSLQAVSRVAAFPGGGSLVVWDFGNASPWDVAAQRYLASGAAAGTQFRVNTYTTSDQRRGAVAIDEGASVVVAWDSPQDGSGLGVYAQFYTFDVVRGDVNGDRVVDVNDVFYLINFLFAGGPAPV
jgi:hypothetical protein